MVDWKPKNLFHSFIHRFMGFSLLLVVDLGSLWLLHQPQACGRLPSSCSNFAYYYYFVERDLAPPERRRHIHPAAYACTRMSDFPILASGWCSYHICTKTCAGSEENLPEKGLFRRCHPCRRSLAVVRYCCSQNYGYLRLIYCYYSVAWSTLLQTDLAFSSCLGMAQKPEVLVVGLKKDHQ